MSAEGISAIARQAFANAMNAIGAELVGSAREALSIPVGRTIGPRGGIVVVRSAPGEFPRADTTDLMNDTKFKPMENGDDEADVYWTLPYAKWLNDGTDNMAARPIADPLVEQWMSEIPAMIAANFHE